MKKNYIILSDDIIINFEFNFNGIYKFEGSDKTWINESRYG